MKHNLNKNSIRIFVRNWEFILKISSKTKLCEGSRTFKEKEGKAVGPAGQAAKHSGDSESPGAAATAPAFCSVPSVSSPHITKATRKTLGNKTRGKQTHRR